MKYFLWMTGIGEGCDYTIGCNLNVVELKARNAEKAIAEVLGEYRERLVAERECGLSRARILECASIVDIDLGRVRANERESKESAAHAKSEAAERAELKRLRTKYGDGNA